MSITTKYPLHGTGGDDCYAITPGMEFAKYMTAEHSKEMERLRQMHIVRNGVEPAMESLRDIDNLSQKGHR